MRTNTNSIASAARYIIDHLGEDIHASALTDFVDLSRNAIVYTLDSMVEQGMLTKHAVQYCNGKQRKTYVYRPVLATEAEKMLNDYAGKYSGEPVSNPRISFKDWPTWAIQIPVPIKRVA